MNGIASKTLRTLAALAVMATAPDAFADEATVVGEAGQGSDRRMEIVIVTAPRPAPAVAETRIEPDAEALDAVRQRLRDDFERRMQRDVPTRIELAGADLPTSG